jgi:SAM-dependent methyltransferase
MQGFMREAKLTPALNIYETKAAAYDSPVNRWFYGHIAKELCRTTAKCGVPRRIIEVGAGTGIATKVLRWQFPGTPILATDSSPAMLAIAQAKGIPGVQTACLCAEEVRQLNQKFDLVFGNICYHWFPKGTANRLGEALSPGGLLAFSIPVTGGDKLPGNRLLSDIYREIGRRSGRTGQRLPSLPFLAREFRDFSICCYRTLTMHECHSPRLFAELLRTRGSWTYLFGEQGPVAEEIWLARTFTREWIALAWHIALVVVQR